MMLPLDPQQIKTRFATALAQIKAGQLTPAADALAELARAAPTVVEIPFQQARIARMQGDAALATTFLQAAAALKPDEPAVLGPLAETSAMAGQYDLAAATFDTLIARNPKSLKLRADKAVMLQTAGRFDQAEDEFRRALKRAPKDGELYRIFLATKKLTKGDPLILTMKKVWADKSVQGLPRAHLGFALSKAMEDSGQTAHVFRYLTPANKLIRAAYPYDATARKAEIAALMQAFDGQRFAPPAPGATDFVPIFVAGLPRSGTTLVEQIIASHTSVVGGGEQSAGLRLAYGLLGDPSKGLRHAASLSGAELSDFAARYQAALRQAHSFAAHITDKSVQTHLIIGLLRLAIPQARFVIVRRDPRDIGLSIYKNLFALGTHRYAYDLGDIAQYIRGHDQMLDFWRDRMEGGLHEVWYEDLVADPEPQARALIAAAGLDWQEGCLNFHQNRREVKTLSVHQVRQPIYQSSAKGWQKHEQDLAPLIAALDLQGDTE